MLVKEKELRSTGWLLGLDHGIPHREKRTKRDRREIQNGSVIDSLYEYVMTSL
jgi:hypothetical protein